jgi:hypothetical protein
MSAESQNFEASRQLLLGNGYLNRFSWQPNTQQHKNSCRLFSVRSAIGIYPEVASVVQQVYKGLNDIERRVSVWRWESNTFTMTLRVVGSDKKGSLNSERVKYGHWQEPAANTKDRPPSSCQRGCPTKTTITVKE